MNRFFSTLIGVNDVHAREGEEGGVEITSRLLDTKAQ